jgi:uncharacterized membrane protein YphA (DoxX/SURF4 family)
MHRHDHARGEVTAPVDLDLSWLDLAARALIATCFLVTGVANLAPERIRDHTERLAMYGPPFPKAAHWIGIAMQFTGCVLLLTGWHADIGVWLLIVFTIAVTAFLHRFWIMKDPAKRNLSRLMVLNNTGLLGGLLLLLKSVQ